MLRRHVKFISEWRNHTFTFGYLSRKPSRWVHATIVPWILPIDCHKNLLTQVPRISRHIIFTLKFAVNNIFYTLQRPVDNVHVSTSLITFKNALKTVQLDNECCSFCDQCYTMVLSNIQCISIYLPVIFNFFSYSILCNLFISPSDVL